MGENISDNSGAPGVTRLLSALGLVALVAMVVVGGNFFGIRERLFGSTVPEPRPVARSRSAAVPTVGGEETVLRSNPWWQEVRRFDGTGATTTPEFDIDASAIQWRVAWMCDTGRLLVSVPGEDEPVVDERCPEVGSGFVTRTGTMRLAVEADGPWEIAVEQQIDAPLEEPPLPEMTAPGAKVLVTAPFYRIERSTTGRAELYRFADGRYGFRFEDFYVTPNVDLEIRLSPLKRPQTTKSFLNTPSEFVAPLDVTAGTLNFVVPKEVDPTKFRSVVIWCPPLNIAYAAATLDG